MAEIDGSALWSLRDVIKDAVSSAISAVPKDSGRTSAQFVRRDQDGTAWYRLLGSSVDTPCVGGEVAQFSEGDWAEVEVRDGRLHVMGNTSDPAAKSSDMHTVKEITVVHETAISEMQVDTAKIHSLTADELSAATGYIQELKADNVTAASLIADHGDFATVKADSAKVHDLTAAQLAAATAYITALNAGSVSAETLLANVAKITNLTAEQLSAATAYIDALNAGSVTASVLLANVAKVSNLTAEQLSATTAYIAALSTGNVTAAQLIADHATIGALDTNFAHVDMANVSNAWIENGTVKDGAITNAMINSVSANKLTAGTIDASNITVTNLNADNITTGTINGQRIGEGSLSLSKLEDDVYTEGEVDSMLATMQAEIDGAIETWTGTDVPTLNNEPASGWTDAATRDRHVGDVYFVVNSQSQQNGYNYRFTKSGSTYSWQLIKDNDVTAALQRLTDAEGRIGTIETFDTTVSSFMTDTDEELESIKSAATTLAGRVTTAEGTLETKVDTSTFNTLSQTVEGNSSSITQLTTNTTTLNGLVSTALEDSIEYIVGTQTATTNLWTGVTRETSLVEGKSIAYRLTYAGTSTAATLNLTLADGTTTGAKPIKMVYSTTSNTAALAGVTTHYPVGSVINMTYDGTQWVISNYNSNVNQIDRTNHSNALRSASANETGKTKVVTASSVIGYVERLNGYQTIVAGTVVDLRWAILWGTGNVGENGTFTNAYEVFPSCTLRNNTASDWTGTQYATAYLYGTLSGNNLTVVGITSTVPTTEDGYVYIPLGQLYSTYQIAFRTPTQKFAYLDGAFQPVEWGVKSQVTKTTNKVNEVSDTVDGHTQRIGSLETTVATKADGSALETVSNNLSTLSQTVDTFQTTVSSTYATKQALSSAQSTLQGEIDAKADESDLTALTTRVGTAESTIEQHSTSIALKANSADVYTKQQSDGLISTEVTNRNAAIQVATEGITSMVSETYTSKEELSNALDSRVHDNDSWVYRQVPDDVQDGIATIESIFGNTVVWNQILNPSVRSVTGGGVTLTMTDGGFVTISGTATGNNELQANQNKFNVVSGHKYLAHMNSNAHMRFKFYIGSASIGMYPCGSTIVAATAGGEGVIRYRLNSSDSSTDFDETYTTYLMVFDLTAMFGAGNEPSTVAEFEALFPEPYYPYDAGSLLPVNMEGIETVGFNQWDGTWENGGISSTSGANETYSGRSRCIGYIPVFPETAYYHNAIIAVFYYDANKSFIGFRAGFKSPTTFTTPAGCHYIRFMYNAPAIPDSTVCINISNPALNGTYKPYATYQRTIPAATYFPNGMRSAGDVYDELTSDAAIVRVGTVDLGTLTWSYSSDNAYFYVTLADMAVVSSPGTMPDFTCAEYTVVTAVSTTGWANKPDKSIGTRHTTSYLCVKDSAYTNAAAFKSAMSGVMLNYALATPTTTPIDPPLTMTYRVEQGGTERVTHTDPAASPTIDIQYGLRTMDSISDALLRIDSAESSITQNATDISLKVSKNDVINQINVSTEGATINANRVNITGDAVFSAINNDTGTTKISGGKIDATSITIGQSQVTDLTEDISDAEKIATNYISLDSTGIRIANENPATATTYQHQTAANTEFIVDGVSSAEFSGSGGRIGSYNGIYTVLNNNQLTLAGYANKIFSVEVEDVTPVPEGDDVIQEITQTSFTTARPGGVEDWYIKVNQLWIPFIQSITGASGALVENTDYFINKVDGTIHITKRSANTVTVTYSMIPTKDYNTSLTLYDGKGIGTNNKLMKISNDSTVIGKTNESHIVLDYHSMQMVDDEGNTYFHVSDLRDKEGCITNLFVGDGETFEFQLNMETTSVKSVKVTGTEVGYESVLGDTVELATAPEEGAEVEIRFVPYPKERVKAYTLGMRGSGYAIGPFSVAEGYGVISSAHHSHAEGIQSSATGSSSHAEGCNTKASGDTSHAEGYVTEASGDFAHSQNFFTVAGSDYQTAIGKYNDNGSTNAFEIGNGTSDDARSNALAVDWSGNLSNAGGITSVGTVTSGGVFFAHDGRERFGGTDSLIRIYHRDANDAEDFRFDFYVDSNGNPAIRSSFDAGGSWLYPYPNQLASRSANTVWAAPNGSNGTPSFRRLAAADLPTVTTAKGGTGVTATQSSTVTGNTSNVTVLSQYNHCWHNGIVCTVTFGFNLKANLASGATLNVGTVPEGWRAPYTVHCAVYGSTAAVGGMQAYLSYTGTITIRNNSGAAVGTSPNIYVTATFALAI